ncbi:hypothetical protein CPLU01_08104 [Colletotrichum plurivorum]|uniref:Transcription factor domain-containing protein n=1 Tax=Colletotrichum plurivorum TaxID=2175906 RepID=A0A8H6KE54_9PEZI|nr:hypothetical protein CPLU01_08104 [Colletotrichum plurivorum]
MENTARPLEYNVTMSFPAYSAQFLQLRTRWETLGVFFCAVLRATMDVPFFPSLFTTAAQKQSFRGMLMSQIGCALAISLSMDCLNDLQLFLQYEHFIIYSYMDGDQGYNLWRSMGDVISPTFALGYHERMDAKLDAPQFLVQLRKTAFARIYSADKNVALFLGRPLRMSKQFCHFHVPDTRPLTLQGLPPPEDQLGPYEWHPDSAIHHGSETHCSAQCASIKEEIMELLFDRSGTDRSARVSALRKTADEHWGALPQRFRLAVDAMEHGETPFERDFRISIRLNHLQ